MPNTSVPADGGRSSALSRRSLLAGVASAAVGPAAVQSAKANKSGADVANLAARFADALAAYHAAERHRSDRETWYLAECPNPPRALTSRGPLGKLLKDKLSWWEAAELRELMRDRAERKHWRAARTALPLAMAYEAEVIEFERGCGFIAAEVAHDVALDKLSDLVDAILATPTHSLNSLALKARVIKSWSRPEMWSDDPNHADATDRALAEILDVVIGDHDVDS